MQYNPQIHHRKSIRLKGYDYAQAGLYFITICIQNRACLFGEIRRGEPTCSPGIAPENAPEMILNDAGQMIAKWYHELENKFHDIRCHEMIVMPNHFHCIIENVGADLRVCPEINTEPNSNGQSHRIAPTGEHEILGEHIENILGEHVGANLRVCPDTNIADGNTKIMGEHEILGEHIGSPLHRVVGWFKTMTTNEYIRGVKTMGWEPFDGKLWQRNYWEHIIRNENDYNCIAEYIINNPQKWDNDKLKN